MLVEMGAELPKDVFGASQGELTATPVPAEVAAQARDDTDAQEEEDSEEE